MTMIMNHDLASMMGHRILQKNTLAWKRSLEKLSSGLRTKISDVDNTAGLAISETMLSRIGGLEKALNNSQDSISMIQTASGALDQTQSMLQRMRELCVQASNDVLTQQDRSYIQVEINEIRNEITNLGNNTQFNLKNILSGDNAVIWSSSHSGVKAIVKGGLRSIDKYGQKYAVDGNYKINVRTEAGKAQVQKTDIFKIKHGDTVEAKSMNRKAGVNNVSASGVPAGRYDIRLAESAEPATEGVLTGSYGIGGLLNSTDSAITFKDGIGSPVTKITVSTTDGTVIWSVSGSDLFNSAQSGGVTSAATQSAFFEGRTDISNGPIFAGVKDEIIAAAREKGITLSGFGDANSESGTLTLNTQAVNGKAPGIKISYETSAPGVAPELAVTENAGNIIAADDVFSVEVTSENLENASVLFEVTAVNANYVTLKATANKLSQNGLTSVEVQDNIILNMGDDGETPNAVSLNKIFGKTSASPAVTISLGSNGLSPIQKGAKFVYSIKAGAEEADNQDAIQLGITQIPDSSDPSNGQDGAFNGKSADYLLNGAKLSNSEVKFNQFFVNDKGEVSQGNITLETAAEFKTLNAGGKLDPENDSFVAAFRAGYVGKTASGTTKLRDIDKFWTSEGVYILDKPKELTLTQGDGKQASIMIYGEDTIDDLTRKLNDAVANGLGQAQYVDDAGSFVSFVDADTVGFESVGGTIVIRSVLAGTKGEITLSGNEEILHAFSLNTIQAAKENQYTVTVRDAHDDSLVAQNVKITGNVMRGIIHDNIDVEFDSMLGIDVAWNDKIKNFVLDDSAQNNGTDVVLHLADNTMVFQMGGVEGDDVMLAIGDMRAHALGLDGVNVMSRERSAYSLTLIDSAIDRVSMQQARLGSAQDRLEHHVTNLMKEAETLTSANSNIRDTNYVTEMMKFTKCNILMNANSAMISQASDIHSSTIQALMRTM